MKLKINSLNITKPQALTQAYQAGFLTAMVHNFRPQYKLSMVQAMVHFNALRELIGEVRWLQLRMNFRFRDRLDLYEKLTYQPYLPQTIIGTTSEFCSGYSDFYTNTKSYRTRAKELLKDQHRVIDHLKANLAPVSEPSE